MKGIVLALLITIPAWSGDLTGYLKNYSFVADPAPGTMSVEHPASSSTRFRLQYQTSWGQNWSFEAAGETAWLIQQSALFGSSLFMSASQPFSYRISDPDHRIFPTNISSNTNLVGTFNLDRLNVHWSGNKTDLIIGRQAVAWGSAKMVNPTDILAPYAFTELDTEYRLGVDAVRLRYALNAMSELDAGYVFGKGGDISKSALFLRAKTYFAGTGASATLMRFRQHLLVGLDLTRAFGGVGTWLEAAYVRTNRFKNNAPENSYVRVSFGADRQLTPTVYGFLEYHYNGAGAEGRSAYLSEVAGPAYTDGAVYLLGKQYLGMGLNVQLTALTTLNTTLLANIQDGSAFLTTRLEHSISDNLDVSAGLYMRKGIYPNLLYASLRWYF